MAHKAAAQETVFALRQQIAKMEGRPLPAAAAKEQAELAARLADCDAEDGRIRLPFDIPLLDEALDGGLLLDAITEIRSLSFHDAGAACGFTLSLAAQVKVEKNAAGGAVLWIADAFCGHEAGALHAGGFRQFGIDPHQFFYASPRRLDEALWLAETALTSGAFVATILEVRGNPKSFGLTESRRLSLRAKAAGRPLFLVRHTGDEEASSASSRMLVKPAPALERRLADGSMLGGSIGHPVFQLTLEKSRNPAPLSFLLEWNPRDRQFHLARDPKRSSYPELQPTHSGASLSVSGDRQDRPEALGRILALERAS